MTLQLSEESEVSKVATVLMETALTPGKYRVGWLRLQIDTGSRGEKATQDYSQTQESFTLSFTFI